MAARLTLTRGELRRLRELVYEAIIRTNPPDDCLEAWGDEYIALTTLLTKIQDALERIGK